MNSAETVEMLERLERLVASITEMHLRALELREIPIASALGKMIDQFPDLRARLLYGISPFELQQESARPTPPPIRVVRMRQAALDELRRYELQV